MEPWSTSTPECLLDSVDFRQFDPEDVQYILELLPDKILKDDGIMGRLKLYWLGQQVGSAINSAKKKNKLFSCFLRP